MENPNQGVIDFLIEQLKRREDERQKQVDQLVQTYRANLGILLSTWRFILITRAAFFVLAGAGLQFIMLSIEALLDTSQLVGVMENYKGFPSGIVKMIRLLTPEQASNLVAIGICAIVLVTITIDLQLAFLQRRCRIRGVQAEEHLRIEGLFVEIYSRRARIELPFWIARTAILFFGMMVLGYLGVATK